MLRSGRAFLFTWRAACGLYDGRLDVAGLAVDALVAVIAGGFSGCRSDSDESCCGGLDADN